MALHACQYVANFCGIQLQPLGVFRSENCRRREPGSSSGLGTVAPATVAVRHEARETGTTAILRREDATGTALAAWIAATGHTYSSRFRSCVHKTCSNGQGLSITHACSLRSNVSRFGANGEHLHEACRGAQAMSASVATIPHMMQIACCSAI
jgi:hypothetical protein